MIRKVMTNLDSIFKSRDITLATKVHLAKAMVFPVVTYGCESWTVKKAECWRIDDLNCGVGEDSWESARRSDQSILKEISPGISLEGMNAGIISAWIVLKVMELDHLGVRTKRKRSWALEHSNVEKSGGRIGKVMEMESRYMVVRGWR